MLKKQARKARAEHVTRCCLALGKKKAPRKPLTELYVDGQCTEDREKWQNELQRHCEEVYTDQEGPKEEQQKNRICEEERRPAVHSGRAQCSGSQLTSCCKQGKLSDDKVNGPDDAVVSEMTKQLPSEKFYIITRCFQERFLGQTDALRSWKIVKLVFLVKPDAEPKKGVRSEKEIALTSVMSKWYASCVTMRMEKEKEIETWKRHHMGGVNKISCQRLQVLVTHL